MAVIDDRNDEQRQAHLTRSKYHGIHGRYGISAGHKFAVANAYAGCKNRMNSATAGMKRVPRRRSVS
jgi:hypothetical protein